MTDPVTIRCLHCPRETTIEEREPEERLARQRWFIRVTTWDEFYKTSYQLICGGNDKRKFHQLDDGFMKETDDCVGDEVKLHSPQLPYVERFSGGAKQGWATGEMIFHLFLPHMGNVPTHLDKCFMGVVRQSTAGEAT